LEWKFVSLKLIPGLLCSQAVLLGLIQPSDVGFSSEDYLIMILFTLCSVQNVVAMMFYIEGYGVDKFDFDRY
jgi:hypothetical protein